MNDKLTIGFNLETEFGDKYSQYSTMSVCYDLGDTDLSVIGDQLNCFLKQCGYIRSNDHMLMESLTEYELEALEDYLQALRSDGNENRIDTGDI